MRTPLRMDVMRDRGALAREIDGEMIENVFRLQLMNASEHPLQVSLKASGLPKIMLLDSQGREIKTLNVAAASNLLIPLKVRVEIDDVKPGTYPIHFSAEAKEQGAKEQDEGAMGNVILSDEKSSFIVPE